MKGLKLDSHLIVRSRLTRQDAIHNYVKVLVLYSNLETNIIIGADKKTERRIALQAQLGLGVNLAGDNTTEPRSLAAETKNLTRIYTDLPGAAEPQPKRTHRRGAENAEK